MEVGEEGFEEMGFGKLDTGSQGAQVDNRLLGSSSLNYGLHRLNLDEGSEFRLDSVLDR